MADSNEQWDEFRWEEFLKENDERADRFAQIVERYGDDPDLEAILAHEMGWNFDPADLGTSGSAFDGAPDLEGEEWKGDADPEPNDLSEPTDTGSDATKHNPHEDNLYGKAYAFAVNSREWLNALPQGLRNDADVVEILTEATVPAAKIVSAWDDDDQDQDVLGFRIAVYKRGLRSANRALESMNRLLIRGAAEKESLLELARQATEVRNGIAVRILEVRERLERK